MDISTAQSELRESYVCGGPGAIVSGLVWLASAITATYSGISTGFAVLFFGGTLIFPISAIIVRTLFVRLPPSKQNAGGRTVIETVFPMIGGLFAAWLLIPHRPEFVFPLSAIAVGAHYFGFRTAYGDVVYWILAAIMCAVGLAAIIVKVPSAQLVPYVIAAIEVVFGVWFIFVGLSGKDTSLAMASEQSSST